MRLALEEAHAAYAEGEVPIGAVLVLGDEVIARDHNRIEQLSDPTAHAEMLCLTAGTSYLRSKYLPQAALYVTLEPCPMCAGAMGWAQLGKVVFAARDPERGFLRYTPSLLHPKGKWYQGPFGEEALELLQRFFRERRV
ncbi:MAG: nucleoside deaminase [Bacteroidia bacterium]|nr:nucleoside deaminase [Bacteroidia bacterium]MCX7764555.1 nucleoside deaminase [Bacteroidia bacterium]MDW8058350.1 nucleoside deaminase [Bacteroidia bacterium]